MRPRFSATGIAAQMQKKISNASGQEFLMAQREPYSFARSMNNLAELANAEMLINSLDSQSV